MRKALRKLTKCRKFGLTVAPHHQCRLPGVAVLSFCACILSVYEECDARNLCVSLIVLIDI